MATASIPFLKPSDDETSADPDKMESLKKLRKDRRTKLTNAINSLSAEVNKDPLNVSLVAGYLKVAEVRAEDLFEVDGTLLPMLSQVLNDADLAREETETDRRKMDFVMIKSQAEYLIKIDTLKFSARSSSPSPQAVSQMASAPPPSVKISKFDGDYMKFPSWIDEFEAMVNQNTSYHTIHKFGILREALTGEPKQLISGLLMTQENYSKALSLLKEHYYDPNLLLGMFVTKLHNVKSVNDPNSPAFSQCVHLFEANYNEITNLVARLSTSASASPPGIDLVSFFLTPLLLSKMPEEIQLLYYDKAIEPKERYNIQYLLDFLKRNIRSREGVRLLKDRKREEKSIQPAKPKPAYSAPVSKFASFGLPTRSAVDDGVKQLKCVFCHASHRSVSCSSFRSLSVSERWNVVDKVKACRNCLGLRHSYRVCKSPFSCRVCGLKHHTLLHRNVEQSEPVLGRSKSASNSPHASRSPSPPIPHPSHVSPSTPTHLSFPVEPRASSSSSPPLRANVRNVSMGKPGSVFMLTASVYVLGPGKRIKARLLLDGGSDLTWIRQSIATQAGLRPFKHQEVLVQAFGEKLIPARTYPVYSLVVEGAVNGASVHLEALGTERLCTPTQGISADVVDDFPHLQGLTLADEFDAADQSIDILIGIDFLYDILYDEQVRHENLPVACKSVFGYMLHGWNHSLPDRDASVQARFMDVRRVMRASISKVDPLEQELQAFWNLEHMGVKDSEAASNQLTDGECLALKQAECSLQYHEDIHKYSVGLIWKPCMREQLTTNKPQALSRLKGQLRRLNGSHEFKQAYISAIQAYRNGDYCEQMEDEHARWFMPHHAVFREDKVTTRCRVVFDGSASDGVQMSLNESLLVGPSMNPDIIDLLLNFRTHEIGLSADIEKAYLRVFIRQDDRPFLRFLWVENDDTKNGKIVEYQMKVIPFGLACSAFLLGFVLRVHLSKFRNEQEYWSKLTDHFYVDDLLTGESDVNRASALKQRATEILQAADMNLRCWKSNERSLCEDPQLEETKVLGIGWMLTSDEFRVPIPPTTFLETVLTKRNVLRYIASIYDPLGWIAPGVFKGKSLMQEIFKRLQGQSWDSGLDEELTHLFWQWVLELQVWSHFKLPRFVSSANPDHIFQIVLFSDASMKGYAAVAYLKVITPSDEPQTFLLASKTRVAPLKTVTIPKLELLGMVLACRLARRIKEKFSLPISSVLGYTDSQIALAWARTDPTKLKVFVANRVRELQQTEILWNHCAGVDNPADFASRGDRLSDSDLHLWTCGPQWLRSSSSVEPFQDFPDDALFQDEFVLPECKVRVLRSHSLLLPEFKYSSLEKAIRITAYVLRFLHNLRLIRRQTQHGILIGPLSVGELRTAENSLWKTVQRAFVVEDPRLARLRPFKDNQGLLRIKTRILNSDEPEEFKTPIVLPSDHPLVKLLILKVHEECHHAGCHITLVKLREKFWVLRARSATRSIIHRCFVCRKLKAKPYDQIEPPLPVYRVQGNKVFGSVGIDFAGPLFIRGGCKVWVVLYTCAVFRAIHLDIVFSLSSDAFILSFRRFCSLFGRPDVIYTDNGTNFVGAHNSLQRSHLHGFLSSRRITWRFIPPTAAWWGGWWERLVRSLKELLRRTLGRTSLDSEELRTILAECGHLINSRPLTCLTDDPTDLDPITPSHFLFQAGDNVPLPEGEVLDKNSLRKKLRYRLNLLELFRVRFKKEYLSQFVSYRKHRNTISPAVGHLVLIGNDSEKRHHWPLGRIVKLFPGVDGIPRVAEVKTPTGILVRPVQRLYSLEMDQGEHVSPPLEESFPSPAISASQESDPLPLSSNSTPLCPPIELPKASPSLVQRPSSLVPLERSSECCRFDRRGRRILPPIRYRD